MGLWTEINLASGSTWSSNGELSIRVSVCHSEMLKKAGPVLRLVSNSVERIRWRQLLVR